MRRSWLFALSGLMLLGLAAPAQARLHTVKFRVTVAVEQKTTWSETDDAQGLNCRRTVEGAGEQRVTFTSRPKTVTVVYGTRVWNFSPPREQKLRGMSRWTRSGHLQITDNCGPQETFRTDGCGSQSWPATADFTFGPRSRSPLTVQFFVLTDEARRPFTLPDFTQTCPYPHTAPTGLPGSDAGLGYVYGVPVSAARLRNNRIKQVVGELLLNDPLTVKDQGTGQVPVTARTTGKVVVTLTRVLPRR